MSVNIENFHQEKFSGSVSDLTDMTSLDQMMLSKTQAMGKGVSVRGKDEMSILPVDEVNTLPISKEQEKVQQYESLCQKILDGTAKDKKEILRIVKEMGAEKGSPYFKTLNEQFFAVRQAILSIPEPVTPENESLKKALLEASNGLLHLQRYNKQIIDRMLNPTVENGGLSVFGEDAQWGQEASY